MPEQPVLETERLVLRPFRTGDGPRVRELAGDKAIAATTLRIPHPYPEGAAEEWIGTHRADFEAGKSATFAVVLRDEDAVIGSIGLEIDAEHSRAELGYWIGKPYWGRGYCTEAAREAVKYAFETLGLNRVCAHHFSLNYSSGKVMRKIGLKREGRMRGHVRKNGESIDLELYGLLASEYERKRK